MGILGMAKYSVQSCAVCFQINSEGSIDYRVIIKGKKTPGKIYLIDRTVIIFPILMEPLLAIYD